MDGKSGADSPLRARLPNLGCLESIIAVLLEETCASSRFLRHVKN